MTITVTEDIIDGTTLSRTTNGYNATRAFIAETTAQETMVQVLAHADIPQYFAIHPDFDGIGIVPIYALDIQCSPEGGDNAIYRVTVQYSYPDFTDSPPSEAAEDAIIQIGSSVTSSKTEVDNAGDQIVVTLTGQPDQVGSVDIQVPEMVLVFGRKEAANPRAKAMANVGKINSASLAGTFDAQTLLCLGIEGDSTDGGETYSVTYRFQYRPEGWVSTVVYIDPETDRPHDDIVIPTDGVTYAEIYQEVDFNGLNLPWNG